MIYDENNYRTFSSWRDKYLIILLYDYVHVRAAKNYEAITFEEDNTF